MERQQQQPDLNSSNARQGLLVTLLYQLQSAGTTTDVFLLGPRCVPAPLLTDLRVPTSAW